MFILGGRDILIESLLTKFAHRRGRSKRTRTSSALGRRKLQRAIAAHFRAHGFIL
jgi:hypothetical protein